MNTYPVSPDEYARDSRGFLVRVKAKTFRRGRIGWTGGHSAIERDVLTGGNKKLKRDVIKWVGAEMIYKNRVKTQ